MGIQRVGGVYKGYLHYLHLKLLLMAPATFLLYCMSRSDHWGICGEGWLADCLCTHIVSLSDSAVHASTGYSPHVVRGRLLLGCHDVNIAHVCFHIPLFGIFSQRQASHKINIDP